MRKKQEKKGCEFRMKLKDIIEIFVFSLLFLPLFIFYSCPFLSFFPSKHGLKIIKSDKSMFAAHNKRKIVNGSYIINILLKRRKR